MTEPDATPRPPTPRLPGAPRRRRVYGVMAGVVAGTLAAAVAVPLAIGERPQTGPAASDELVFSAPETPGEPLPEGVDPAAAPPGTVLPDGSVVPDPAAPGAPPAPGAPGAPAPGAPGAPGAPAPRAPGAPGAPGAPAPAPGQGGSAGGAPAAPGAGEARRASDQGVTADTVKLGVFLVNFSRADEAGASYTGFTVPQQRQLAETFRDAVNESGGINGRSLTLAFREVDILDQQTMRNACTDFARTDKVFAVTQVLGVYGDPILICARDFKLPFLANDGAVSNYYTAAKGYLFTTQPSTLRTQLNMVRELVRLGELRGRKVGFLYEDGYLLPDNQATVAELKRSGVTPVEGVVSSSDFTTAIRQVPTVAKDMCDQGVDYVLYAVNSIYGSQFASNMERFGCRPAYAVSDFDFTTTSDAFPQDMPASWFDRALAITSSRTGEGRVGKPEPEHDAACRQTYERRRGVKLDRNKAEDSNYFSVQAVCTSIELFRAGLSAAGVNPTRDSFAAALSRVGAFANGGYGTSSFRPGRTDAPDVVRVTRGDLSCKCWKPQTDFYAAQLR